MASRRTCAIASVSKGSATRLRRVEIRHLERDDLDEPTTGLHFADIEKLLEVLQRLAGASNTVVVIEHNHDVIKRADWIIDLGPEGGEEGGEVLAFGTLEQIAQVEASHTGRYLREVLPRTVAAA